MFAKLDNGSALCLATYGDIQKGAIVPPVNELWAQVVECDTWGEVPVEYTPEFKRIESLKKSVRSERDSLLASTDWIVTKSLEAGVAVPTEYSTYRQALRDITDQSGFPEDVVWPTHPEEV